MSLLAADFERELNAVTGKLEVFTLQSNVISGNPIMSRFLQFDRLGRRKIRIAQRCDGDRKCLLTEGKRRREALECLQNYFALQDDYATANDDYKRIGFHIIPACLADFLKQGQENRRPERPRVGGIAMDE